MKYPMITVELNKIRHNASKIVALCENAKIEPAAVTKVFCAYPEIAQAVVEGGIKILADSRLENLIKLQNLTVKKIMLRLPMISQVKDLVKYADISLNSELETIREIGKAAVEQGKVHDIILMVDLGDLREGFLVGDLVDEVEEILTIPGVKLVGIGTNLTCYGGVIPKPENLGQLVNLTKEIQERYSLNLEIVSGGNSSSYYLIEENLIPEGINNLRFGEVLLFGRESAYGKLIPDLYNDAFTMSAEIIEIKDKPSLPLGEIGMDAFGKKPEFVDKGVRRRAILAVGKQDVDISEIEPKDEDISIFGGSSDHLIIDITDSKTKYKVGDIIDFKLNYVSVLRLMTSSYIYKNIR